MHPAIPAVLQFEYAIWYFVCWFMWFSLFPSATIYLSRMKFLQVTIEKNELKEENSSLESQIEVLQSELHARVVQSKPDLNIPPEFQQPELSSHFPGDSYGFPAAVEPTLSQAPAVLVVPIHSDLQAYSASDVAQLTSKPASNVSKPHARYPNPADSWPSQLLGENVSSTRENADRNK